MFLTMEAAGNVNSDVDFSLNSEEPSAVPHAVVEHSLDHEL